MTSLSNLSYHNRHITRNRLILAKFKFLAIATLLIATLQPVTQNSLASSIPSPNAVKPIQLALQPIQKPTPDFDKEVLAPLRQVQAVAAAKAAQEVAEAEAQQLVAEQVEATQSAPVTVVEAAPSDGLVGSIGYSLGWGNCVNESGVNNPHWGNPINWPITSTQPWIGASALFYFNHVAVVTGFWSNGDIEVRQQNSPGAPHRYPRSMFRGFR